MKTKVVVVSLYEETCWPSSHAITSGLREAYSHLHPTCRIFDRRLSHLSGHREVEELCSEISGINPDWIVFIDTWPVYGTLLHMLFESNFLKKRSCKFRFHVYGDFTLRSHLWVNWARWIEGNHAEWACASSRQAHLVSSFIKSENPHGHPLTWVSRFPVDVFSFQFDAKLRAATRRSLHLQEDETLFLYTGRLSLQKNVLGLLRAYSLLEPRILNRSKLLLTGGFDDHGGPFFDTSLVQGQFYRQWMRALDTLPHNAAERVIMLRHQTVASMPALYNAADVFVSLSLQHDEDFGMSPAEAACAGLPLVLTEWGGYADFKDLNMPGSWVAVRIADDGPVFSLDEAAEYMTYWAQNTASHGHTRRSATAEQALRELSVTAVRERIRARTLTPETTEFRGFHPVVKELCEIYDPHSEMLLFPSCESGSLYQRVYTHYAKG